MQQSIKPIYVFSVNIHIYYYIYTDSLKQLIAEVTGPKLFTPWFDSEVQEPIADLRYLQTENKELLVILTSSHVVQVYELSETGPSLFQNISSSAITILSIETVTVSDRYCIAATGGRSELYCWNKFNHTFEKVQDIFTVGAVHVKYTTADGLQILIFSCNGTAPSFVYVWDEQTSSFLLLQYLPTTGAVSTSAISTPSSTFLSVAQHSNGEHYDHSILFQWNGTHFNQLQLIHSRDTLLFSAGEMLFLTSPGMLLRFDVQVSSFVNHSALPYSTSGVYGHFTINTEHYVVVGKGSSEEDATSSGTVYISQLYGAGIVPHQHFETLGSVRAIRGWSVGDNTRHVLAVVTGVQRNVVSLYKWSTATDSS